MTFSLESTSWSSKFEGPDEVVSFLEVRTYCVNFVDEIFNSLDSVFTQNSFNCFIGFNWNSLLIDLSESSFKDKSSDGFSGWVSVSNVGLNSSEHIDGSFVNSDEHSIMKLS